MTDSPEPEVGGGPMPDQGRFADSTPGCDLFIPRAGDRTRSAAILEHAQRWWRGEGDPDAD